MLLIDLHVLNRMLVRSEKREEEMNSSLFICDQVESNAARCTYFKLSAYMVSFELDAPCGRTRSKYVPTFRFSNFADAVSRDIGPTNQ